MTADTPEVLDNTSCPKCKYPRAHKIGETLWLHCNGCGCEYNMAGSIRDTRVGAVLDIAPMSMIAKDWPEYSQQRYSRVVDDGYAESIILRDWFAQRGEILVCALLESDIPEELRTRSQTRQERHEEYKAFLEKLQGKYSFVSTSAEELAQRKWEELQEETIEEPEDIDTVKNQ